ncbi:MAG: hypothetical protein ACTSX9_05010 [Candidatus Njordarchaeales archaeon]
MSSEQEIRRINLIFRVRIIQFIFFSIFAFGFSWLITDLLKILELPISTASIGTMVFGIVGMVGCEIVIRWINKVFFQRSGSTD